MVTFTSLENLTKRNKYKRSRGGSASPRQLQHLQSMLSVVTAVRGSGRAALKASHLSLAPLSSAAAVIVAVTAVTPLRTAVCPRSSLSFLYSLRKEGRGKESEDGDEDS